MGLQLLRLPPQLPGVARVTLAAFFVGLLVGVIVGMVIQWIADLPKDYRR
jgi:fructose-specific phosphotransferase system IIC component